MSKEIKSWQDCLNKNKPYGRNWSDFLLPDQIEFIGKAMEEYHSQFTGEEWEYKVHEKRGDYWWVNCEDEIEYLKMMGLKGWELVSVRIPSLTFSPYVYYWKRTITNKTTQP